MAFHKLQTQFHTSFIEVNNNNSLHMPKDIINSQIYKINNM